MPWVFSGGYTSQATHRPGVQSLPEPPHQLPTCFTSTAKRHAMGHHLPTEATTATGTQASQAIPRRRDSTAVPSARTAWLGTHQLIYGGMPRRRV